MTTEPRPIPAHILMAHAENTERRDAAAHHYYSTGRVDRYGALPCISCDAPSTHRTTDDLAGYPVCDECDEQHTDDDPADLYADYVAACHAENLDAHTFHMWTIHGRPTGPLG